MKYIFVNFRDDWAGEMDIDINTAVKMREEDFEVLLKMINTIKRKHRTKASYSIGTNESIEYETGGEFVNTLNLREITEEEYKVFEKFGVIDGADDIFYNIIDLYEECKDLEFDDEDEDEEEDY